MGLCNYTQRLLNSVIARAHQGQQNSFARHGLYPPFLKDQEDLTPGKPISPAERRKFKAWQKKALGRPRVGEGFRRWNVSLERSFARSADAYAKKHGKTRSRLIAEALTMYIQKVA